MTKYEANFQKILQAETVSVFGQTDLGKFTAFHQLLAELFPALWKAAEVEEFHGSLLLRWPGKDNAKMPRMFMNHHDVVEATGAWTHAPFGGEIADGKIYGRGAVDTKGGLFAMLQAADDLCAEGFVPGRDIYFESACNEEISGEGAQEIAKVLEARGLQFDLILDEGAGVFGEGTQQIAMLGIGEKTLTDLRFIARSSGGHASRPPKNQPLVRLGRFMAAAEDQMDLLFPKQINEQTGELQQTSLAFTMAKASNGTNVLPVEASVVGNMRSSHHQGVENSIAAISALAKQYDLEVEILDHGISSVIADFNSESCSSLKTVIHKFWPDAKIVPTIMTGATDVHYMTAVSANPIRFSPFLYSEAQKASIHSLDENVDVAALPVAVAFFKEMYR